jgi:hypothetical protein
VELLVSGYLCAGARKKMQGCFPDALVQYVIEFFHSVSLAAVTF